MSKEIVLDPSWFDRVTDARGESRTEQLVGAYPDKLWDVAVHTCGAYVDQYCDPEAQRAFAALCDSDESTPWAIVLRKTELNSDPPWAAFVTTNLRDQFDRSAEIAIDPSIISRSQGPAGADAVFIPLR